MIDLRKLIQGELKTVSAKVYYQVVPEAAVFPYIVYDIPNIFDDGEGYQLVTLDIDGWDSPVDGDTTPLETLMANVNMGLNKKTLTTDMMAVAFYLDNKLTLTDDDPRIIRRKYTYQGRKFGGS